MNYSFRLLTFFVLSSISLQSQAASFDLNASPNSFAFDLASIDTQTTSTYFHLGGMNNDESDIVFLGVRVPPYGAVNTPLFFSAGMDGFYFRSQEYEGERYGLYGVKFFLYGGLRFNTQTPFVLIAKGSYGPESLISSEAKDYVDFALNLEFKVTPVAIFYGGARYHSIELQDNIRGSDSNIIRFEQSVYLGLRFLF